MKSKYHQNSKRQNLKFMQTLSRGVWNSLKREASKRGIDVQEYIRAIVIPEHLEKIRPISRSEAIRRSWIIRKANANRIKRANSRKENPEIHLPLPKPTPDQLHQMETTGPFRPIGKEPIIATN